jgi:hypothetical protein
MRVCRPKLRIESRAVGQVADTVFYGLRRVNPFQGMVDVVGRLDDRVISIDGVFWKRQTLAPGPGRSRARDGAADALLYCRFGPWSRADGHARVCRESDT